MTRRNEIPVRFDYSFERLGALSKLCATRAFSATLDPLERSDVAWCGIAEALYEATSRPTPAELLRAGTRAILEWSDAEQQAHGFIQRDVAAGFHANHRFWMYWHARSTPGPESGVVERVSMVQIWPLLTGRQREALIALAVHNNYELAAAALGLSYKTYCARVERARAQFLIHWHQGERPSKPRRDQRIPSRRGAA